VIPERFVFLTSREYLFRLFSNLLLFGLVLLVDGWLLVRASRAWGVYLSLAVEAGTALVGVIIIGSTIHTRLNRIHSSAVAGSFNPVEYAKLAAAVAAAAMLILPGFAGDAIGIILYLPPGRHLFTWIFLKRNRSALEESYEYYKLSLFSTSPGREYADPEKHEYQKTIRWNSDRKPDTKR